MYEDESRRWRDGARGGKERGSDGGWKWLGASVLCECLCAALAKKNKVWATLGSDFSMEAWQETGSSGGGGVGGMAGGPTLHVLPEKKRKRFRDRTIVLSSLTAQPATMAGVQSPSVWVPYMNPKFRVAGAAPASNTFTVITIGHESPMQIRVPLRGQPSSVLYLHLDRNSAAAEPEGYYSEHVQRISAGYAAFGGLGNPLLLILHVTRYSACVQPSWSYLSLAAFSLLLGSYAVTATSSALCGSSELLALHRGGRVQLQVVQEGRKEMQMVENKESVS